MSSALSIASWNVNGLRSIAAKTLPFFLESIAPDILCLQEIKANADQAEALGINYPYRYWHPAERPGYSGTGILSKIKPQSIQTGFLSEEARRRHPQEGRILTAEFSEFYLVNVYVPNAKADLSRLKYRTEIWGPDLRELLKTLAHKKPVIACGDFNVAHEPIDLARPEANRHSAGYTDGEREDFTQLLNSGLVDVLRRKYPNTPGLYSWWSYFGNARSRNIGWRIDYFLTSPQLVSAICANKLLPSIRGSDHCPMQLGLEL